MNINSNSIFKYQPCIIKKTNKKVVFTEEQKKIIYSHFNSLIQKGKNFTNGKIHTITSIYLDQSNQIIFETSETDYAHYLYSLNNQKSDIPPCISIACNSILKTTDNFLVFAKMSSETHLSNKIKFIGGSIDDADIIENIFEIQKCMNRELMEEIGQSFSDLSSTKSHKPSYIITRNQLTFFNFLYIIDINMDKKMLTNKFKKYNATLTNKNKAELDSILAIKNTLQDLKNIQSDKQYKFIDYFSETIEIICDQKSPGNLIEALSENQKLTISHPIVVQA